MYYFIGIKGTGMASLALMLKNIGEEVIGSDLEKHFFTQDELINKGIKILNFNENNIKDNYTVIIGNAFKEDFCEVKASRNNPTCKCYRYHEFLSFLIEKYNTVAICGSHGKTTTTTMAKTVFENFYNTAYLIGDGQGYLDKNSKILCLEADEFERHFENYKPKYAIITNIEIDHVDYFKDEIDYFNAFNDFVKNVKDVCVYFGDDDWCKKLEANCKMISFGFDKSNHYQILNLKHVDNYSTFELSFNNKILKTYNLPFVGKHQIIDAVSVIVLTHQMNLNQDVVEKSFINFKNAKRRFVVEKIGDYVFIDDYAHHPTEIKATLETVKTLYPNKKIVAIFKPHRASRVLYFANQFKKALEIADDIYLMDFTSIDDKQDGTEIDITYLQKMIDNSYILDEDENSINKLAQYENCCYVFMSSKDIYHLAKMLKEKLTNR